MPFGVTNANLHGSAFVRLSYVMLCSVIILLLAFPKFLPSSMRSDVRHGFISPN